jgi:hypothetical protein
VVGVHGRRPVVRRRRHGVVGRSTNVLNPSVLLVVELAAELQDRLGVHLADPALGHA